MEHYISEIHGWTTTNKLKLNGVKTVLIILSSAFNRQDVNVEHFQVETVAISPALSVSNLGVVFVAN
jgi:hypothetical protein